MAATTNDDNTDFLVGSDSNPRYGFFLEAHYDHELLFCQKRGPVPLFELLLPPRFRALEV